MLKQKILSLLIILAFLYPLCPAGAQSPDSDNDGISDEDEINVYYTDPENKDTDFDGFSDWIELNQGFSPYNPEPLKLADSDYDKDGLTDKLELKFRSDPTNPDSDGDGLNDGKEIARGYDPSSKDNEKFTKKVEINLKQQELKYYLKDVLMGKYSVSTGKPKTPTPKGTFKVINKVPKAWSKYGLWMPYWVGLGEGKFGIHELPYWPNGYREGENHLGKPVSHGCIRLGIGPAKKIYDWIEVDVEVKIY